MKPKNGWSVLPSEQAAERKRRQLFAQSSETVWLGEQVFSLPHFLKTISRPERPLLTRHSQKHLLHVCLKKAPLRYFGGLKTDPSLVQPFLTAIRRLKRYAIFPDALEAILKESGSLKEYDLLLIYQAYEKLKEELGCFDEEDLYFLPNQIFTTGQICFENFLEIPKALVHRIETLKKQFPKIKLGCQTLPDVDAASLSHVKLFSLPTPFQETHWFLERLAELCEKQIPLYQIGILAGTNTNTLEAIWQKLKQFGLVPDGPPSSSPNLTWGELPAGRAALKTASQLDFPEAPISEWLASLGQKLKPSEPFAGFLTKLNWPEALLSLGKLNKQEWLRWLEEALTQKPERKIKEQLEGLQWIEEEADDFPPLQYLWVPGLIEGQFPKLPALTFFQDKKDRGRKEWAALCEAFPDPQTLFAQKQKRFLYQLSQIGEEVWLTTPRLNSLGQGCAPSPLTWDFGETQIIASVPPPLKADPDMEERLARLTKIYDIEVERAEDRLETKPYHAQLQDVSLTKKIPPMQTDHLFSASQLEKYAQCPFKYFANRVLGIPEQKEFAPELDPDDRGSLFHNSMEIFMKENTVLLSEARRNPAKEEELFERLSETIDQVFAKEKPGLPHAHPELFQQLKTKTLAQAKKLLTKELSEAKSLEAPLTPTHFEWTFGTEQANALKLENTLIGGRIDRIDCDPDQKRFLVLDYKTGSTGPLKEKLLEGLSLQLPLYILAVRALLLQGQEPIGALLIATKKAQKKDGLVDVAFNETHFSIHKRTQSLSNREDLEKILQTTTRWVQTYVSQIRSGYFSAQPKECKEICDYKEICRYAGKPFV